MNEVTENRDPRGSERYLTWFDRKTALFLARASGLFSILVVIGLLWNALAFRPTLYFDEPGFLSMKQSLLENPKDERLKQRIREEDLRRRQHYYRSRERLRFGSYLLFGGLAVFALSLRRLIVLGQKLPDPIPLEQINTDPRERSKMAFGILAIPVPVAVATLACFVLYKPGGETPEGSTPHGAIIVTSVPAVEEIAETEKWTQFLGTKGTAHGPAMDLPLSWDAETGENILWKVPVPLDGNSSPIVWRNQLFLTGADKESRKVFCFNVASGSLAWTCSIRSLSMLPGEIESVEGTGLAAPTPATDGRYVFAFFGTAELAAVDYSGKQVWTRWFGKPDSKYGLATSPRYYDGKLILQLDQEEEGKSKSALYAIDPETGKDLWKTDRDVPGSWSSPIVVNTGTREEILTAANPWVVSYDPQTGKQWWRAKVLSGDVAPVPAYGDGLVFTVTEYSQLSAIRTGGATDVTETHVAWTYDEELPDVATPFADGRFLLMPTGYGTVNCFEAKTGKIVWTEDFDVGFWSSPVLVGESVFLTNQEGRTFIFKLNDAYELLGQGSVGEMVVSTPAFAGSKIFIRGRENLYCIGKKP